VPRERSCRRLTGRLATTMLSSEAWLMNIPTTVPNLSDERPFEIDVG
jgi:hypothetical protein